MKPVCIVVQNVYDIDPRVRRKAEALIAAGFSVDVLALSDGRATKTYTLNAVNVYTLSLSRQRGSLLRYAFEYAAFFLWVLFRMTFLMWRKRYAVIDVNTLPDFLIFAAVPARWMGARLILDMHEITPEFYISRYGTAKRVVRCCVSFLKYVERISFNSADFVITISEPIRDLLVSRGLNPSKTVVVMNAVDEDRFALSLDRPSVQAANQFVIVYHGTLSRIYGLDIAIEAFHLAQAQMPGAELWILGSGPEEQALAELVRERGLSEMVKLPGRVPFAEIPQWLDKCAVGVLPIRRDVFLDFAFPNKLPEFIVTGKPVLMSRLKGIRYYFSEDALAYFEPEDPVDLANQMVRVYRDRELRDGLTARARAEYKPVSWVVMKLRYLRLVEGLIGSARAVAETVHSSL